MESLQANATKQQTSGAGQNHWTGTITVERTASE
jgi:hypothetical protein